MGIRKITFDNGNIVLAKDQAILYDLLLKKKKKNTHTHTPLSNGETIYQNSTGFLIQNENEKLKYTYEITDDGAEFIFNPQLYLSICGRIIKLEKKKKKNTKLLVDKNYVANNENYYMVIRVDLNKEAKIINGKLKEFGNSVKIKLINKKIKLIQDNLNQKPNNGIYEFPLISFIKKYNPDNSWKIKTKNESTYLLPILIESTHNPSKLLTITQKIEEEKELLQDKQKQLKDVKNYLTNLEYKKMEELEKLENLMKELIKIDKNSRPQIPENSNWKLIDYPTSKNMLSDLFKNPDNKWYVVNLFTTQEGHIIRKFKFTNETKLVKKIDYNEFAWKYNYKDYEGLPTELVGYYRYIYLWNGLNEPKLPEINNGGIIIDWNEKTDD